MIESVSRTLLLFVRVFAFFFDATRTESSGRRRVNQHLQHLRSPGGHSPMPMASGGGGSISRLSMTCTSARYPTASATLTTPVEFEGKARDGRGRVRMSQSRDGASAGASRRCRGRAPRRPDRDNDREASVAAVRSRSGRTRDDGGDLRALHLFVVAELGEGQLLGRGRGRGGLVILRRAQRGRAPQMRRAEKRTRGRAARGCARNARLGGGAMGRARAGGDDGGAGDGEGHAACSCGSRALGQ